MVRKRQSRIDRTLEQNPITRLYRTPLVPAHIFMTNAAEDSIVNPPEWERFLLAANNAHLPVRTLCLTVDHSSLRQCRWNRRTGDRTADVGRFQAGHC